jgi:inhibitor of KinA
MPDHLFSNFSCYSLSEKAVTVEFGNKINGDTLATVTLCNQLLLQASFPGFITTTTAYTTITVFYDPTITIKSLLPGSDCFEKVVGYISKLLADYKPVQQKSGSILNIPVCYGGNFGPDLIHVAQYHKLRPDDVIQLHSSAVYTVYMIGFLPGFAYLGGMTEQLFTPRKASPRKLVTAGSVGIAGQQTGIYPMDSPGGWQLIGQTPVTLFDVKHNPPSLLKAGDLVQFSPISGDEFKAIIG